jgi:hypothetical protein
MLPKADVKSNRNQTITAKDAEYAEKLFCKIKVRKLLLLSVLCVSAVLVLLTPDS